MGWRDVVQDLVHGGVHDAETAFDGLVARLREKTGRTSPVVIQPYRGFGNVGEVQVRGRVLEDQGIPEASDRDTLWQNVVAMYRRFESDEVPGAEVELCAGPVTMRVRTDDEGYFDARLPLPPSWTAEKGWVEIDARLVDEKAAFQTVIRARIPAVQAAFGVISDIDDTILPTGATRLTTLVRNTLFNNARTRLPFTGAAAFYQALARGPLDEGTAVNPFFYVSSSPWNLYDFLEDFFELNEIPEGPILLRDLGVDSEKFIKEGHDHKLDKIERVLTAFPGLPFILIGDSGQEDPELYTEAVKHHPDRIRTIYIRDVSDEARGEEVDRLAEAAETAGVQFRRVADSAEAAHHAAQVGLITASAAQVVQDEVDRPTL